MSSQHEVEISDDWTPEDWLAVVDVLDKRGVYLGTTDEPSGFGDDISKAWKLLQPGPDLAIDVAYDVGCAEGTFTEVWLTLLQRWENKTLPRVVVLIEPEERLLSMAVDRLQAKFPTVEFKATATTFDEAVLAEDRAKASTLRPQLVVASHSCYYFKDLRATLEELSTLLDRRGVLWLVARDRHCGIYQSRFELLSRFDVPDTAPQHFSDAVCEAMSREWKMEKVPLTVPLRVPEKGLSQHRVFSFLTHLKLSPTAFDEARKRHEGLFDFSETHVLATSQSVASAAEFDERALTDEDRASLRVVELARSSLQESGALILDIQLARFDHLQRLVDIRDAPREDETAAFRPRHIRGAVSLWGHAPTEASNAALRGYFTKHPSFLLYDTFFSQSRAPVISSCLGMFANQLEYERPIERLPMERFGETWQPSWDTSTFDVAWADWQLALQRLWANALPSGGLSLKCLAVGSRLGEVLTITADEADTVDRSAALFVTFLQQPRSDGATDTRALTQAYKHIRELMGDYVGLTASLRLQERNRQKLVAHQHTVFNALAACGTVGLLKQDQRLPDDVRLMATDDEKAFRLLRLSLNVAFGRDGEWLPEDLDGLIQLLEENTLSTEAPVVVDRTNDAPWRFGSLEERRDAFTVLVNLWKNAAKYGKNANSHGFTRVRLDSGASGMTVEITNDGQMIPKFLRYLQGHPTVPDPERRGLQDVLDCVERRQWKLVSSTSSAPPTTTIAVTFTTRPS